jgi:Flp pilus assembly protein TadD
VGDLGTLLIQMGEWGEAAQVFRIYLEREPESREARVLLGLSLYKSGRPQEAIEEYRRIPEVNADILVKLGDCHLVLGKVGEAIALYEEARGMDPQFHPAWNNLGVAYLRAREPGKARDAFLEAARIAIRMGKVGTAEGNLRRVLAIDETDEEARRLLESISPN